MYYELLALVLRASTYEQQDAPQDQRQRHYEEVVYAAWEVMRSSGWVAGLTRYRTGRLLAGCVQWAKE